MRYPNFGNRHFKPRNMDAEDGEFCRQSTRSWPTLAAVEALALGTLEMLQGTSLNRKLVTWDCNPKPQTPNPKPQTPNPKDPIET